MKLIYAVLLGLTVTFAQAKETFPLFDQSLEKALQIAKVQSGVLKSAHAMEESSIAQAHVSRASLFPQLSLQGSYFYQTNVPSLFLGPGIEREFGTHNNYSVGPVLSYTFFDAGKDQKRYQGAVFQAQAQAEVSKTQSALLELMVRQAYFRVQYALRELELTLDSLKLSLAQREDISLRFRAGAASQLDQAQSARDVLSYRLRFKQAQNQLATEFRTLLALEGDGQNVDASRPVPMGMSHQFPAEVEEPTLELKLEPLSKSVETLSQLNMNFTVAMHPEVTLLAAQTEAKRTLAHAESAGLYPKIILQAKTQYQYPNLVIPVNVWQNTVGVSVSLPLFEGDASRSRSNQYLSEAISHESQKEQKLTDLNRDQNQAKDTLSSLRVQKKINDENIREAQLVERLTYQSYKGGKSRYLDVQDANLKLLQAQVSAAQIDSEILKQLARLAYLSIQ